MFPSAAPPPPSLLNHQPLPVTRYEMLAELSRREREARIKLDPEIDAFTKEGRSLMKVYAEEDFRVDLDLPESRSKSSCGGATPF
jgi:hypothetical protein